MPKPLVSVAQLTYLTLLTCLPISAETSATGGDCWSSCNLCIWAWALGPYPRTRLNEAGGRQKWFDRFLTDEYNIIGQKPVEPLLAPQCFIESCSWVRPLRGRREDERQENLTNVLFRWMSGLCATAATGPGWNTVH